MLMYYVTDDRADAQRYIAKLDAYLGYPNPDTKTETYAKPVPHRGQGHQGKEIVVIKLVWSPLLGRAARVADLAEASDFRERQRWVGRPTLDEEGAFDEEGDV